MSLEVHVPEEIMDYKEKIVFGLSLRELKFTAIGLALAVPSFLALNKINSNVALYAVVGIAAVFGLLGFFKMGGYNFETFMKIRLGFLLGKNKRAFETDIDANIVPVEAERYRSVFFDILESSHEEEIEEKNRFIMKKRGEKNAFQKEKAGNWEKGKNCRKSKKDKGDPKESFLVEVSEKSIKRERKKVRKELKAKAAEYRAEKRKKKKAA